MKPLLAELQAACPNVPPALLTAHLERLEDDYFKFFSFEQICAHLHCLAILPPDAPVKLVVESQSDGKLACTVIAYDYPGLFALITGTLAAHKFNILAGEIFTYKRASCVSGAMAKKNRRERDCLPSCPSGRRMIVDYFVGTLTEMETIAADWETIVEQDLRAVVGALEKGAAAAAKQRVNEMVAARLADLHYDRYPVLYPVRIEIENTAQYTRLLVFSQDTPAFLFAMSSALAIQNISIERVRIRTESGQITDEIDVQDQTGRPIASPEKLDRLKLSVLLTKQFTYFLSHAPDPSAALARFEQLVENILKVPDRAGLAELLVRPDTLPELARLLGASDFLWEDFIRLQYETILPILQPHVAGRRFAHPTSSLPDILRAQLAGADDFEEQFRRLNAFKDQEIFLIDLDHILNPKQDVRAFAEALTGLAEAVVQAAAELIYRRLSEIYGPPATVGGLEPHWAILGLGKFGGAALGYASDIELLLVYSDAGQTAGAQSISNAEFFAHMARLLAEKIQAKREGIFHVDLRLRPYGSSGPLACSLESFCRYYAPDGPAQAFERLALVRLRAVAGNREFGARLERLRDELLYAGPPLDMAALRELREKQWAEKAGSGRPNAKFSPGALVDLEYDVQLLQVLHGRHSARLRTPRIHEALAALAELGVLEAEESRQLTQAYYFFRRLINGLRMLRGSARDLYLPPENTPEFAHLARRMGYQHTAGMAPEVQLRLDFETQTALVRAFVERHFGREALPGPPEGNLADIVLSDRFPDEFACRILKKIGFRDDVRALHNLRRLAGSGSARALFANLAVLAGDALRHSADPDMALNNWERFVQALPGAAPHYELLFSQPRRLEILLGIFSASQFLADTLIRNPDFWEWVTSAEVFNAPRPLPVIEAGLRNFAASFHGDWRDAVRRFRRREILRTGARDICLQAALEEVTADITALAEAVIRLAMDYFWGSGENEVQAQQGFCVIAFGKLGGAELNYSSDIDLLGICAAEKNAQRPLYSAAMRQIAANLAGHTTEGYAYRVDFRLRPYGRAGELVYSVPTLLDYYRRTAALWEIQALLKARPVAGDFQLGNQFLAAVREILQAPREAPAVSAALDQQRRQMYRQANAGNYIQRDIKNGAGGIRDIEFLVQGLQLIHARRRPEIIHGNTLAALARLAQSGLLPESAAAALREDYVLLRRIEHCLQLFEDRQVHELPAAETELSALARRIFGVSADSRDFAARLGDCQARVRRFWQMFCRQAAPEEYTRALEVPA